jgi:hypothetical protein
MTSGVTTRCAWPGRRKSVTELKPFMKFLVHSYTCCSDRHASPYELSFVDEFRWVSPLHCLKNRWQNAVLLWCMLQAGPPSLHYYCAVVLHSCIVLPPVNHSSNHQYHCCHLRKQSSCGSNFYRTFTVFIWLSLVTESFSAFHIYRSGHLQPLRTSSQKISIYYLLIRLSLYNWGSVYR